MFIRQPRLTWVRMSQRATHLSATANLLLRPGSAEEGRALQLFDRALMRVITSLSGLVLGVLHVHAGYESHRGGGWRGNLSMGMDCHGGLQWKVIQAGGSVAVCRFCRQLLSVSSLPFPILPQFLS